MMFGDNFLKNITDKAYNSFYVYKYATGCSAGVSFAQDILKNGSDNYMSFLKKGSSDYPINLLKSSS